MDKIMQYLITLINGLSLGGIYAMIALGYTMVYGIAKMLNFAHGDIIMIGGYMLFLFASLTGSPYLAIVVAIVICALLGITMEKAAYRPLRGASPLAVLITAIGVSYLLQSIAQISFGTAPKYVKLFNFGQISFGSYKIQVYSLITLAITVSLMILLTLFIKYTKVGRAMIATSEDRDAAKLMGIDTNKIITITFLIGSILAAVASIFYLFKSNIVTPTLGSKPGIKAFTAAVIGGIGSIPGAMIGGIFLGVIECITNSIPAISPYTDAIEFGILIVILLIRPAGLLGKRKIEKV